MEDFINIAWKIVTSTLMLICGFMSLIILVNIASKGLNRFDFEMLIASAFFSVLFFKMNKY